MSESDNAEVAKLLDMAEELAYKTDPASVDGLEMSQLQSNRLNRAIKFLTRAHLVNPTNIRVILLLAEISERSDNFDAALHWFAAAAELEPGNGNIAPAAARAAMNAGLLKKAIYWLRIAINAAPQSVTARNDLAVALLLANRIDESMAEVERVISIDANDGEAMRLRKTIHYFSITSFGPPQDRASLERYWMRSWSDTEDSYSFDKSEKPRFVNDKNVALSKFIGERLTSVEFSTKIVGLASEVSLELRTLVWPVIITEQRAIATTDELYRNELCAGIGKIIVSASYTLVPEEAIHICLEDNSRLEFCLDNTRTITDRAVLYGPGPLAIPF